MEKVYTPRQVEIEFNRILQPALIAGYVTHNSPIRVADSFTNSFPDAVAFIHSDSRIAEVAGLALRKFTASVEDARRIPRYSRLAQFVLAFEDLLREGVGEHGAVRDSLLEKLDTTNDVYTAFRTRSGVAAMYVFEQHFDFESGIDVAA